jgi:4-aminobutyrate aminotransferase/(S)-3-amino-2-methylpropionate transaminase
MWYSAVNFGYANPRLNNALKRQIDTLPQVASQYLHREKIELAALIAQDASQVRREGPRPFQCRRLAGGRGFAEARAQCHNGKSLMFAFEGGYHGRTLGASAITSSYRYRRRFGHFGERAHFIPFPYHFRGPKGMSKEEYGEHCVQQFARLFESEYNGVWDPKTQQAEYAAFYVEPLQGTGGYVIPPKNFFIGLKKVLDDHGILMVVDEIQMGFYRTGKLWSIEHFGVTPDVIVFGKAVTNGLNPLSGVWAKEKLINPTIFPPGSTHSTFNANPLGTAVALEAMKMMAEDDYETMVMEKGAYFLRGLEELKATTRSSATSTGSAWRCASRSASRMTATRRPSAWST